MELKEFVRATLVDIIDGVREGQEATRDAGARIIPNRAGQEMKVAFDVAVVARENATIEAGGGVSANLVVAGFSLGTGGETSTANAAHNRVQFSIMVLLPHG